MRWALQRVMPPGQLRCAQTRPEGGTKHASSPGKTLSRLILCSSARLLVHGCRCCPAAPSAPGLLFVATIGALGVSCAAPEASATVVALIGAEEWLVAVARMRAATPTRSLVKPGAVFLATAFPGVWPAVVASLAAFSGMLVGFALALSPLFEAPPGWWVMVVVVHHHPTMPSHYWIVLVC